MKARQMTGLVMILAAGLLLPGVAGAQAWFPAIPGYKHQDVQPKVVTPNGVKPHGYGSGYGKHDVNININVNKNNNQNTNFIRIRR